MKVLIFEGRKRKIPSDRNQESDILYDVMKSIPKVC